MATAVGLNMKMTADTSGLGRGMTRAEKLLNEVDKNARSAASSLRVMATIQVGGALLKGIGFISNALNSAAKAALNYANSLRDTIDRTAKLARQTGIGVEALQGFAVAASLGGTDIETFANNIKRLTVRVGRLAESGKTEIFEKIGIDFERFQMLAPEEQFKVLAMAIDGIQDPAEKARVAVELFGRAGAEMLPMLNSNFVELQERLERLGIILSEDQTTAIEDMNDALTLVRATFDGIIGQVAANLAPLVTEIAEEFLSFVEAFEGINGASGGNALADAITNAFFDGAEYVASILDPWVMTLVEWAGYFSESVASIAEYFGYFERTVELLNAGFLTLRATLNNFLIGLSRAAPYALGGVLGSLLPSSGLQAFREDLAARVEQDRQAAAQAFAGQDNPGGEEPGAVQDWLRGMRERFESSRSPEARAARAQERLFARLNDQFGQANELAQTVFGDDVPQAVADAAAQVENLLVAAMEDGFISEEEAQAIAKAQADYNQQLRNGQQALDAETKAAKEREKELEKIGTKIMDLAEEREKRRAEIESDRLEELSRASNQALEVSDIRNGGISEVFRIATGREDPAIAEYRKQLSELQKIEQRIADLRADKVKIIGGAGRAA